MCKYGNRGECFIVYFESITDSKSGPCLGVFEQSSAAEHQRDAGGLPDRLPRLHTEHLCLVCCTVLLRLIMRNPDWSSGHVVCAVISDVHTTLRSHRSLPPGEMEVCVCFRACPRVCECVTARSWLFCSHTSQLPPSHLLSTDSAGATT